MTIPLPTTDFRAVRHVLESHEYAIGGEFPPPSDRIDPEIWNGIMHLPDDVAVRISDHNGNRLRLLYTLWGDWIVAVGNPDRRDELFNCMLDANDCLQCANFDLLHGFYRAAISNLRTALELVMIGTFGNLRPTDPTYSRWKQSYVDQFGFSYCRKQLANIHNGREIEWLFAKTAFPATTYAELCNFTHARPDSSDGALWQSNGPVYNNGAITKTFKLSLDVYSIGYLLVKVGRSDFRLPEDSEILFDFAWTKHHGEMVKARGQLYGGQTP